MSLNLLSLNLLSLDLASLDLSMPVEVLRFYLLCGLITLGLVTFFGITHNRSMLRRSLTILALLHILVAILWWGEWGCVVFALALCGAGVYEVSRHALGRLIANGLALIAMAMAYGFYHWQLQAWWFPWLAVVTLTFAAPLPWVAGKSWAVVFGLTGAPLGCVALMQLAEPVPVLWMCLIIVVQFNDTLALLAGKRWGQHKLFPRLSPNKSVEGFIGGAVGTTLAILACLLLFPESDLSELLLANPATPLAWVGVVSVAWLSTNMGDLLFSKYKRAQGIKDFSTLLPGHGGLIDRFDSLLVLAPVAWLALRL